MTAHIEKGSDGKFYITPISSGMSGVPFKNVGDASVVCEAINMAYRRGQEDIRSAMRDLLNVAERDDF